jgi:hypothetical protein
VDALDLKAFYARYEGGGSRNQGKEHAEVDAEQNPHSAAMAAKLQTEEGRAAYRKRKWIAEPPNGWIRNVLGLRQFSLRGLHRVRAEWRSNKLCVKPQARRLGGFCRAAS